MMSLVSHSYAAFASLGTIWKSVTKAKERLVPFSSRCSIATYLLVLPFLGLGINSVNCAEWLYVSLPDANQVVRFDVSLGSSALVQGSLNTFISTGVSSPRGLAFNSTGDLYVSNFTANNIVRRPAAGGTPVVFADNLDGVNSPMGLAVDSSNNVYAANSGTDSLLKITPGGSASTLATFAFATATRGVAVDPVSGNIFVANLNAWAIQKVTPGGTASVYVNTGVGSSPNGVTFDTAGNLYTALSGAGFNSVIKTTPGGTTTTFASGLSTPLGVAFDSLGNFYVTEPGANRISKYDGSGAFQFSWATTSPAWFATTVPEPSTYILGGLATGLLALIARKRKRRAVIAH